MLSDEYRNTLKISLSVESKAGVVYDATMNAWCEGVYTAIKIHRLGGIATSLGNITRAMANNNDGGEIYTLARAAFAAWDALHPLTE